VTDLGSPDGDNVESLILRVVSNNIPTLVYHRVSYGDLIFARYGNPWTRDTIETSVDWGGVGFQDPNDVPQVAYTKQGALIYAYKYNGTWSKTTLGPANDYVGEFGVSMAVDGSYNPYIGYHDNNSDSLRVAFKTSNNWTFKRVTDDCSYNADVSIGVVSGATKKVQLAYTTWQESPEQVRFAEGSVSCCSSSNLTEDGDPEQTQQTPTAYRLVGYIGAADGIHLGVQVPEENDVRLSIFDVGGRRLGTIHETLSAGTHDIAWSSLRLKPGLYWVELRPRGATRVTARVIATN
jgi:hypothetical protein